MKGPEVQLIEGIGNEEVNSEEKNKIKKSRAASDKELLAGGAEIIPTGEQVIINPMLEQIKQIEQEHKNIDIATPKSNKQFIEELNSNAKKLLNFLIQEQFLIESDDNRYVIDTSKLEDTEFKERLNRLYLSKSKEGKNIHGGLARTVELLGDLNVVQRTEEEIVAEEKLANVMSGLFRNLKENKTERALKILEKGGVLEIKDGMMVVDTDMLQDSKYWASQHGTNIMRKKGVITRVNPQNIYSIIADTQVVSSKEYKRAKQQNEQPTLKPLFNVPNDIDDFFDIENIKEGNYHLNLWEMYKKLPLKKMQIKTKDGQSVSLLEIQLATKIFRDLRGYRDKKGSLMIFDEQNNKFVKMSGTKLKELGATKAKDNRIVQALQEHCPNLLKKQLIKLNDFNVITGVNNIAEELVRKETTAPNPNRVFEPEFDSVRMYIGNGVFIYKGNKIPLANLKIVILDDKKLGIVRKSDNREELVYTIDRVDLDEKEEIRNQVRQKKGDIPEKKITQYSRLGKKEMDKRIHSYNLTEIVPQKTNEDNNKYTERLRQLPNYDYVNKVTHDLSVEVGVGIHKLSWREQLQIAQMNYESGFLGQNKEFINFTKNYKLDGLRTFLSLEQGEQEMGAKILFIGEQLQDEPEVANRLFAHYAEMVDGAEDVAEAIIQAVPNQEKINKKSIINSLLFESKELLSQANTSLKNKELKEKLVADLEKVNTKVLLLNKVIKQLPREDIAKLNLRDIEEIDRREDMPASELLKDQKTLEQIKDIIKVQFPEGDDIVFEEECRNDKDLRLTITMANNEVVSFFAKKRVSDNVDYIDWFISNPDAPVKGLGEATLRLGFSEDDKVSNYAVAKPHVKSFSVLVEKLGFVSFAGSTVDGEYTDHYSRVRKLTSDQNLETKKISETSLDSLTSSIKTICLEENKIESYLYKGKKLDVCKVAFHEQTHKDDILETDKDGWIMAEIKRQHAKGNVLTRYISESNKKDNQTFFAIFEEDNASKEDMEEIDQVVAVKSLPADNQLDSKKALSS